MKLSEASSSFLTDSRTEALQKAIDSRAKGKRILALNLPGSAAAFALYALKKRGGRPYVVVCADGDDAGYMYNDLVHLAGPKSVAILPSGYRRDIKYGQPDPPSRILRTEALDAWSNKETRWLVTSPEALAERVPRQQDFSDSTLRIAVGEQIDMEDVIKRLAELGFTRTDYVYEPGQYARRGSIIDVYSYSNELPYRIDFFDDEPDSIRTFNVETQLSEKKLDEISIIPQMETGEGNGISFLEFIGEDAVWCCKSLSGLRSRITEICGSSISSAALHAGDFDANALQHLVDADDFLSSLDRCSVVEIAPGSARDGNWSATVDYRCSPQGLYHKNFNLISDSFSKFLSEGFKIYVLADSRHQTERLASIFADRGEDISFTAVEPTVHEGFVDHIAKTCFFTDHQIFDRFHKYSLKSDMARSGKLAMTLKELQQIEPGDYVVNIDHGIGQYAGLVKTTVTGHLQEMIKIVYQNGDMIFMSLHSLHKLSKYRSKEGEKPKLSKLGSGAWNRLKERTKAKMKDIARDLIRLYAARNEEKGFAYSPDSYLQQELEASFIYEDTPDQLKATQAVKQDMESSKPMDRLVCGDVGFGKTEIAIRAAFKAATDGKQVAVLVPTTVLALQHYNTFSERLKDFPVRVEFLSRAKSAKQVKEITADLAEGKIDILIGTHKLLGKGVNFKDLGLLIIDEEQKFGVAVKEKLKQLKVNVDTLTMSATPIPRTLQFSLMGARDLSTLNTPPANRHPIVTTVAEFSEDVIAEAINFELSRNGQVFFVSNRIEHLYVLQNKIERLVPGVRVVVAHGQMPPEKMEKAIVDFGNHDYDVLLSTTIIENGIDMPNVNTILVNQAQNFGLSELHQLRGRVGRSNRKAFCYLLVPPEACLTPDARRRLQAIESFSDLGSGIHIAMQDLDIRGAGNLLGAEQSGFIADLGFEAYQKILKESMIELRTEEFPDTFTSAKKDDNEEYVADCMVESDLELLLPSEYVPQETERIMLYQELDNMEREEQTVEYRERLVDRFGKIPHQADELIKIVPLRIEGRRLGIERLVLKGGRMSMYFVSADNKAYYQSRAFGRVLGYIQQHPERSQFRQKPGENKCSIAISGVPDVTTALSILREIASEKA